LLGHPDLFIDGIHPKAEGAQLIANAVYTAIDWTKVN
jgi:lysophospholipase L1-like esterase